MRYLIKNGSIIDPARRVATVGNVLIEAGKVARVIDLADLTMEHGLDADFARPRVMLPPTYRH